MIEIFKKINNKCEEKKDEIMKQESRFTFSEEETSRIIEDIEEKQAHLKNLIEIKSKKLKLSSLGNETKLKRIADIDDENKYIVRKYKNNELKLGKLKGILVLVEEGKDYLQYYLTKTDKAYVKSFQFPSSDPEEIFRLMYRWATVASSEYINPKQVEECYIIKNEEDRERIRKLLYIPWVISGYYNTNTVDGLGVALDINYLFLGDKVYIIRNTGMDEGMNKVNELIDKILKNYECIYKNEKEIGWEDIPF